MDLVKDQIGRRNALREVKTWLNAIAAAQRYLRGKRLRRAS